MTINDKESIQVENLANKRKGEGDVVSTKRRCEDEDGKNEESSATLNKCGAEGRQGIIHATFDNSERNWTPAAEPGITTLVGPYLRKSDMKEDLVGQVEAEALFTVTTALAKLGYTTSGTKVPDNLDPMSSEDFFNDADLERLKKLPIGVAYNMLKELPEALLIYNKQGEECGRISHYGLPPNFTWVKIRCQKNCALPEDLLSLTQDVMNFAFVRFNHDRTDITERDYLTTLNKFAEKKNLQLFVESGNIDESLATLFTVEKSGQVVAKALVNYTNASIMTGGPNILQIEVAEEWKHHHLMDWLLTCIEDHYVHRFTPVLGDNPGLLYITAANVDDVPSDEEDWFLKHGFTGHGRERSKPLAFKVVKHGLKTALDELGPNEGAAAEISEAVVGAIPDTALPALSIALTEAVVGHYPARSNKQIPKTEKKQEENALSYAMAKGVIQSLPEKSISGDENSSQRSAGIPAGMAITEEASEALAKEMVKIIPNKKVLAKAVVSAAKDAEEDRVLLGGSLQKAAETMLKYCNNSDATSTYTDSGRTTPSRVKTPTGAFDANFSKDFSPGGKTAHRRKGSEHALVSALSRALPDNDLSELAVAANVEAKELQDVNILSHNHKDVSRALAGAVRNIIPENVLPEVAVALTQAVVQKKNNPDKAGMCDFSKYAVHTSNEDSPGALANAVLKVIPDSVVPEMALILSTAVMDAIPKEELLGLSLQDAAPPGQEASKCLAKTVIDSIPKEALPMVAVAIAKRVVQSIPKKDGTSSESEVSSKR